MSGHRIRAYQPDDEDRIIEIWSSAARQAHPFLPGEGTGERERLIREVYVPAAETWVYESENRRIEGFISLLAHVDAPWEVGGLFIDPPSQCHGIGKALITHAAQLKGILTVLVFEKNTGARRAYDRMGFKANGTVLYEDGFAQIGLTRTF